MPPSTSADPAGSHRPRPPSRRTVDLDGRRPRPSASPARPLPRARLHASKDPPRHHPRSTGPTTRPRQNHRSPAPPPTPEPSTSTVAVHAAASATAAKQPGSRHTAAPPPANGCVPTAAAGRTGPDRERPKPILPEPRRRHSQISPHENSRHATGIPGRLAASPRDGRPAARHHQPRPRNGPARTGRPCQLLGGRRPHPICAPRPLDHLARARTGPSRPSAASAYNPGARRGCHAARALLSPPCPNGPGRPTPSISDAPPPGGGAGSALAHTCAIGRTPPPPRPKSAGSRRGPQPRPHNPRPATHRTHLELRPELRLAEIRDPGRGHSVAPSRLRVRRTGCRPARLTPSAPQF